MMDPDFQIRGGGQATRAPPLNPPLSAVALVTVVCVVLALIATTLFTATTLSGGSGGPAPPLLFEQNEAQRAEKSLFGDQFPPLLSGCG